MCRCTAPGLQRRNLYMKNQVYHRYRRCRCTHSNPPRHNHTLRYYSLSHTNRSQCIGYPRRCSWDTFLLGGGHSPSSDHDRRSRLLRSHIAAPRCRCTHNNPPVIATLFVIVIYIAIPVLYVWDESVGAVGIHFEFGGDTVRVRVTTDETVFSAVINQPLDAGALTAIPTVI